jgi:glycosyltransferase involved in cell wall biosynthesis
MEICLIGDFSEKLDEGYKNTSHYLANSLSANATVVRLNAKQVRMGQFWRGFARSRPQIIHTIAQPTNQSLVLTRMLQLARPRARTVVSALKADNYFAHGQISPAQRKLIPLVRPDLVLVQNAETESLFARLGCPVAQLPNGVDLERFRPAPPERKRELRRKYGLDADRPVTLHVGHLEAARNLASLEALPGAGIQVAIAGSLYMGTNQELIERLECMGYAVFKGYQPHIEELYMLADCYIFTPRPGNSLTMPLSVLEAMACNLPVITTRFSGLEHAFAEGAGLTFIDDTSQVLPHVQASLATAASCATREMVRALSWQAIAERLQAHYERLVAA